MINYVKIGTLLGKKWTFMKKMDLIIFYQDKQNIGDCFPNFQQLLNCFYYFFKRKYYENKCGNHET